jgi:hypothetical protein
VILPSGQNAVWSASSSASSSFTELVTGR